MLDYAVYTNTAYRFTGKSYSGVWKELPKDWLEGLNIGRQVGFLRAYKCFCLFFYCDFFYGGSSSLPPPAQCTSSSFTDCPRKGLLLNTLPFVSSDPRAIPMSQSHCVPVLLCPCGIAMYQSHCVPVLLCPCGIAVYQSHCVPPIPVGLGHHKSGPQGANSCPLFCTSPTGHQSLVKLYP